MTRIRIFVVPALVVFAACMLVSCAGIRRESYDYVRPGSSTRQYVLAVMGEPWGGGETDVWVYIDRFDANVRVEIEFDADGIVSDKRWLDYSARSLDE